MFSLNTRYTQMRQIAMALASHHFMPHWGSPLQDDGRPRVPWPVRTLTRPSRLCFINLAQGITLTDCRALRKLT